MPNEGFKSITVPEELFKKLEKMAHDACRTIPKQIEYLIEIGKEA